MKGAYSQADVASPTMMDQIDSSSLGHAGNIPPSLGSSVGEPVQLSTVAGTGKKKAHLSDDEEVGKKGVKLEILSKYKPAGGGEETESKKWKLEEEYTEEVNPKDHETGARKIKTLPDLSRISSLLFYPSYANFAKEYLKLEASGNEGGEEACEKTINHFASTMELDNVEPLLQVIEENWEPETPRQNWAEIFQVMPFCPTRTRSISSSVRKLH